MNRQNKAIFASILGFCFSANAFAGYHGENRVVIDFPKQQEFTDNFQVTGASLDQTCSRDHGADYTQNKNMHIDVLNQECGQKLKTKRCKKDIFGTPGEVVGYRPYITVKNVETGVESQLKLRENSVAGEITDNPFHGDIRLIVNLRDKSIANAITSGNNQDLVADNYTGYSHRLDSE